MPDDKRGREKQARNADRRQRERAIAEELDRMGDPEPTVDEVELARFEAALEQLNFPVTGTDVVSEMGHRDLEGERTSYSVAELVPATESEFYETPEAVRKQVQRPTVARAMKRIIEATATRQGVSLDGSQREAYERTFKELEGIDPVDEDEGIGVMIDWILSELEESGDLPGSRAVRRRAAKVCRSQGYEVRNDEWLGV